MLPFHGSSGTYVISLNKKRIIRYIFILLVLIKHDDTVLVPQIISPGYVSVLEQTFLN